MTDSNYYVPPPSSASLFRWLDLADAWHIEYGGYLTNHISHNWLCLDAAGASEEVMTWWHELYTLQLSEKPAREPGPLLPSEASAGPALDLSESNWTESFEAIPDHFDSYRRFFARRLSERGVERVLREDVPQLAPGLAGAALHALIHLGWGVDAEHTGMIRDGLAYLACAHQRLALDDIHDPPHALWTEDALRPIDASVRLLDRARSLGLGDVAHQASLTATYRSLARGDFQHRIIAFNDPDLPLGRALNESGPLGLPGTADPLAPALDECFALMGAALRASNNEFFVLHGLTSLHAAACLVPRLEPSDQRDLLTHWWRAAMATLVAQDFPGFDETVRRLEGWRSIEPVRPSTEGRARWLRRLRSTFRSRDEHVPKALYAMWRWTEWGVTSERTQSLLEEAADWLARPHPSGQVHRNMWFSRAFSDASREREGTQNS